MDTFEYCSLRLRLSPVKSFDIGTPGLGEAVITMTTDKVEEIILKDAASLKTTREEWTDRRTGLPLNKTIISRSLNGSPLEYIQPYISKLGKEGWEVIEYKSSEVDNFGEALLKRKILVE